MKIRSTPFRVALLLSVACLVGCAGDADRNDERSQRPASEGRAARSGAQVEAAAGDRAAQRRPGDTFEIPSGRPKVPAITVKVVAVGEGAPCGRGRRATIDYIGTFEDGREFDRSRDKGTPYTFLVGPGSAIAGWHLVAERMRVGDRWEVTIPYQLAYGEAGHPAGIPARTDLNFDMELLGIR